MNTDSSAPSPAAPARSRLAQWIGLAAVLLAVIGVACWWLLAGQYRETTEDAFVDGNVVAVTAQVTGVVTAIGADDTDYVRAGSELVKLDDTDARLALSRAEAQLARSVRQVRAQYANVGQTRANLQLRQIELAKAKADLARRRELVAGGAISGEEVKHAEDAVRAASAALGVASQQLAGSTALIGRTAIADNPDVLAAASQVRDAWIAVYRTSVPAPVAGMVTRRNVQLGQKINPGVSLMSVVPLDHLWVNANFKESQLRHIRIGQKVDLVADVYGDDVVYHGSVVGQEAGTGSAFSLLPAQNATGNWIKVVQRVPIRIALDPRQVAKHPLQLGLSMKVVVATRQRDGSRLVTAGSREHGYRTDVFANELASADAVVDKIIAANQ
ncbi:HlyD family efflux transporter periplasmic adaptor subunit [Rhodanobacter glycinis]|uniref:HlyD family efflux transporter periplasmic adaptor subunit n=1 Tax=Rhodanobacter glycinis TaxID=582702 RepID=A0A502C661_9GAMM|nr:efflux RND transporter periplasmic adaptor subunit [Rhodanobacter glycinis]TPG07321.1 HlyD family efflux transporter periplasmic adaptor subunit [Rhodanobacter glycinis]